MSDRRATVLLFASAVACQGHRAPGWALPPGYAGWSLVQRRRSGQITYFNKTGLKNPVRPDGTVEPLLGYEAAFMNERGAIAGFATIDIVDGPNGTTIMVRE